MSALLKDPNKQIPNGFRFIQAETGWDSTVVLPKFPSLTVLTNALIQHRLGNPYLVQKNNWPTSYATVEREVAEYNAAICISMGWTDFVSSDVPIPKWPPPSPLPSVSARVAGAINKTHSGIKIVRDWLGDGLKPVAKELAEKRASVCETCPQNQQGNFWQSLEAAAAHKVKTLVAIKSDLELKTNYDDKLKSCQACTCWLPLKVWCEIKHIETNTTEDVWRALDPRCWCFSETGRKHATEA